MAVDLSIEVFAYDLFNAILRPGSSSVLFKKDRGEEPNCNEDILKAVNCRQLIFHDLHKEVFEKLEDINIHGPTNFLEFIKYGFRRFFEMRSIFEFIFATCAFVADLCLYLHSKQKCDSTSYAYLCWAMYVDLELKSQFYEEGGWEVLKYTAKFYTLPHMVLHTVNILDENPYYRGIPFDKLIKGMVGFHYFRTYSAAQEFRGAKTWVNFRLQNKIIQDDIAAKRQYDTKSVKGLEHFLIRLKILCDPLGKQHLDLNNFRRRKRALEKGTSSKSKDLDNDENICECELKQRKIKDIWMCLKGSKINESSEKEQVSFSEAVLKSESVLSKRTSSEDKDLENNTVKLSDESEGIYLLNKMESLKRSASQTKTQILETLESLTRDIRERDSQQMTTNDVTANEEVNTGILTDILSKVPRMLTDVESWPMPGDPFISYQWDGGKVPADIEDSPTPGDRCIWDHGDGGQEITNLNTGAILETKTTSKDVENSNEHSPKSKASTPRKEKIRDVQTRHLTTENIVAANQEGNKESQQGHLNTGISTTTHLEEEHLKSAVESLQIQDGKCIADLEDGEQNIKNVNTGAIPKTKRTSKDVNNSNDYSPESKVPTKGQEPVKVKKKKKKKRQEVDSFDDDTRDILKMILVLGCQPSLNYVRSKLKSTKM